MNANDANQYDHAAAAPDVRPRRRTLWASRWIWAIAIIVVIAAVITLRNRPIRVDVVHPLQRTVALAITATGSIEGTQESALSPEYTGLLSQLYVEEGDMLDAGQIVAILADSVPSAEVLRAQAALRTAQAQLDEATGNAHAHTVTLRQVRSEVNGQIKQAEANLAKAIARLQELEAGGTAQQRSEADAMVAQARAELTQAEREVKRAQALTISDATAKAALDSAISALDAAKARASQANVRLTDAERELRRAKNLYAKDAIARAVLDAAQTTADAAREEVRHAKAEQERAAVEVDRQRQLLETTRQTELQRSQTNLEVAQHGLTAALARQRTVAQPARGELIAQQRAETEAARTVLASARETGRHRIAAIEAEPVNERVSVARKRVDEAAKALASAFARLNQTQLKSPFAGVVTHIVARPGDAVGPSLPVIHFSQMGMPEIHVDIDERDVGDIRVGQQAIAVTDTHPDENIEGTVSEIGSQADTQRGTVRVKVQIRESPTWLRSGMTADVTIITQSASALLVVPTSAVMRSADSTEIYTVKEDIVEAREISTAKAAQQGVVVTGGLSVDDIVVVDPTKVSPGQRVRINERSNTQPASSGVLENDGSRGDGQ